MPKIKLITENLADELLPAMEKASGIYILTSFVMESGVKLLEPYLKAAVDRDAGIKILAGDYLFITEPHSYIHLCMILIIVQISAVIVTVVWVKEDRRAVRALS